MDKEYSVIGQLAFLDISLNEYECISDIAEKSFVYNNFIREYPEEIVDTIFRYVYLYYIKCDIVPFQKYLENIHDELDSKNINKIDYGKIINNIKCMY